MLKRPNSPKAFRVRERGWGLCDQLADILLIGWWWGHQESMSSTLGSNLSGVSVLVGSVQLTSSTWWGFQYLQNSLKDVVQNIIYSPGGGTKSPWLYLTSKLLLFCLAWLFSFLHFLTSLIKFILWLKFFYRQKVGRERGRGSILGRPHRVMFVTVPKLTLAMWSHLLSILYHWFFAWVWFYSQFDQITFPALCGANQWQSTVFFLRAQHS